MRTLTSVRLILAVLSLVCTMQSPAGTLIDVAFTSAPVTSKTGFAATGLSTNDFWNTYVLSSEVLPNLALSDDTPSGAMMTVANDLAAYANGSLDPMYGGYLFCASFENMTVTITNLISGAYDLYLYGHGNEDDQNSIFEVTVGSQSYGAEATTNGSGWLSSVWEEGAQYVEFTNVGVVAGQTVDITVEPGGSAYAVLSGLQLAMGVPRTNGPPFILSQPADQSVIYGSSAILSVLAQAGGPSPLTYQWYFDNGSISGATNSSYDVTNAQVTNAGSYSVTVTNADGSVGSSVGLLNVIALPIIQVQPVSEEVIQGSNATFAVEAVGPTSLQYQWLFDDSNISGATNSIYSVVGAQLTNGGNYSVIVSDPYGSVTSLVAALTVVISPGALIDVAFTSAPLTAKTGFAAIGLASNDFWNTCFEAVSNLTFVDGVTASGTGVTVANDSSEYGNGASDPMYGVYLYTYVGNIVVSITNLVAGTYDFYVYGHGNNNVYAGVYQLSIDSQSFGTEETTNGPGWLSAVWQEGVQYVEFTNVIVAAGQTVTINAEQAGALYYGSMAVISGLQIAYLGAAPPNPLILSQPTNQDLLAGATAIFTVFANGVRPLTYQWEFDNSAISGATNSSYSINDSQPSNDGYYSVIVSNVEGTVTSTAAVLTVNGVPFLRNQLTNHTVISGATVSFSISASGATPLAYEWQFNGDAIVGATNSAYTISDSQPSDSGNYSVIVTNAFGSVTSLVTTLNVLLVSNPFIDVAFTAASVTGKYGLAAAGLTATDFWNTCSLTVQQPAKFLYVDGAESSVDITFGTPTLQFGYGKNGAADPMFGTAIYPLDGGNPGGEDIYVVITGLAPGGYSFYVYGHGSEDNQNSVFELFTGSRSYGAQATEDGVGWISPVWQEGVQFVQFANVSISADESQDYPNITVAPNQAVIVVEPGVGGVGFLSGLQIEFIDPTNAIPYIETQPTNLTIAPGSNANLFVLADGATPLAYQWFRDGIQIAGATNSNYAVTSARSTNVGNYSVVLTNAYGSFTSIVVPLNVVAPVARVIDVAITAPTTSKVGFAATGVTSNDYWNAFMNNNGVITNLAYMDGTPSGAAITVPTGMKEGYNGASDPMYGLACYQQADIVMTVTNLPPATYDLYLYGHGSLNDQNSIFEVGVPSVSYGSEATTNGPGWIYSAWLEGVQYVEFTNVSVDTGQTLTITAEPGASGYAFVSGLQIVPAGPPSPAAAIVTEPPALIVSQASNATFTVLAEGSAPLAYQWLFDNTPISGATNSTYSVINAQLTNDGGYSVIISNAYGSVTSSAAALTVFRPVGALIDVAFAQSIATGKTGFAATGVANNDFWNTYSSLANMVPFGTLPNLIFSDGVVSPVGLNVTMIDYPASGVNGASDPMYGVFLYGVFAGGGALEVTNLSPGIYDFYLYGHGSQDDENTVFQLSVGSQSYGSEATINGPGWEYSDWQEGVQYVEFANVSVSNGQDITITFEPGASQYFGVVSGMQIAYVGQAAIVAQPEDQPAVPGSTATFSVGAIGTSPLAYQWLFDNTAIPGATSQSYSVTNAQTNDAGSYSVIVKNPYVGVTSSVATLTFVDFPTIISPPTSQEVFQGSSAIFSVEAIGSAPLSYRWQFKATNILGATNSSYSLTNAESDNAGNYSVTVSNAYGSVTSVVVTLNVVEPIVKLIDVAFTGASVTGKRGYAAIGMASNDFWNSYVANSLTLPNLLYVDGTVSSAGLTVETPPGGQGVFANGASDPMYGVYLSEFSGSDIMVTITNLLPGTYDFYLYGHANANADNNLFYLTAGSQSYGSEATTNGSDWLSPIWQEGSQYVEFSNVIVAVGQPIAITVSGSAALSGMQIALVDTPSSNAFINTQPTNQTVVYNSTATFSVLAGGAAPLAYQWLFDGAPISTATNSSYSVANAQSNNAGSYSVIVANAYGSVTSAVATLTVITPLVTGIDRNWNANITLNMESSPNASVRIWTATNLEPPIIWTPIFTNGNTGASGQWQFTDTNTASYEERFYRFSIP